MVTIDLKLADIKLEELLGLNAEVREKSVVRFRSYSHCKNAVKNICRYLKRFYTYKKIK